MRAACGLAGDASADGPAFDAVACPSLACAEAVTSLLDDCAASVEHQPDAAREFFTALERSAVFAGCEEMEQGHAEFAEVQVEVTHSTSP